MPLIESGRILGHREIPHWRNRCLESVIHREKCLRSIGVNPSGHWIIDGPNRSCHDMTRRWISDASQGGNLPGAEVLYRDGFQRCLRNLPRRQINALDALGVNRGVQVYQTSVAGVALGMNDYRLHATDSTG